MYPLKNREELKRWFIQQDVDLFRYKLNNLVNEKEIITHFIEDNGLQYFPVSYYMKYVF